MEVFLLLFDEIDDAVAIFGSLLPRLFRLLAALSLLFATGFAVLIWPRVALSAVAMLLSATLFERLRRRRREEFPAADR